MEAKKHMEAVEAYKHTSIEGYKSIKTYEHRSIYKQYKSCHII
jgi:hypothetical protein